jgi:hypothetical protein
LGSCAILGYAPEKSVFALELLKGKKFLVFPQKSAACFLISGKTLFLKPY